MKGSELSAAAALYAEHEMVRGLRARLDAGEGLHLLLGKGADASEMVLSPSYLAGLRADVETALRLRLEELAARLRAIGVEPE